VSNSASNIHIAFDAVQGAGHFRVQPVAVEQQYCAMDCGPDFPQVLRILDHVVAPAAAREKKDIL
jgi:hypothetical protein